MIAIGCDHSGVMLKHKIIAWLEKHGHAVLDLGTNSEEMVDYPIYGQLVAEKVAGGECERGIVICGTGIGISIAANKVTGIRCALCTDSYMARKAREHNDANVLAIGARTTGLGLALDIVEAFMVTEKEEGRHAERVQMLTELENKYKK